MKKKLIFLKKPLEHFVTLAKTEPFRTYRYQLQYLQHRFEVLLYLHEVGTGETKQN